MFIPGGRLISIIMKVTSVQDVGSPDIDFHRDNRSVSWAPMMAARSTMVIVVRSRGRHALKIPIVLGGVQSNAYFDHLYLSDAILASRAQDEP